MPLITAEQVREILSYDPETGFLTWKKAISKKSKIGHIAGGMNITDGYFQVRITGRLYRAHRLAWLYMTGEWPAYIDHKNRIRSDNRWANLRNVSNGENMQNRLAPQSNNTTGFLGVSFDKSRKKYSAQLMLDGRTIHLGAYESAVLAHAKYLDAKKRYHSGCYFMEQGDKDRAKVAG